MGFSKATAFPVEQQSLAICGKLISHPARIQIIQYLHLNGSSCMHEIADSIPLARGSVTQHLTKLREYGFLKVTEKTPYVYYEIDDKALEEMIRLIWVFFYEKLI